MAATARPIDSNKPTKYPVFVKLMHHQQSATERGAIRFQQELKMYFRKLSAFRLSGFDSKPTCSTLGQAYAVVQLHTEAQMQRSATFCLRNTRSLTTVQLQHRVRRPQTTTRAFPNFPRILEELPLRRLPHRFGFPRVLEYTDKELNRLLPSTAGTTPELLVGTSLLFAVITLAVTLEFLQRSFQSVSGSPSIGDFSEGPSDKQTKLSQASRSFPAQQQRQQERLLSQQIITYEKFRGLRWLAIVTALVVWSTGILNKDNPLQP